jgi:hypothetical protein
MKYALAIVCLSVLLGVSGPQSILGKDVPASASQLLQQFESALKAKDKEACMSLLNSQGISIEVKSFYNQMITELFKLDVQNVVLAPIPGNFPANMDGEGFHYGLNVTPVGVLDVQSTVRKINLMQLPYGKKDGVFYIAGLTEKLAAPPMSAINRTITVRIETTDGKPMPGREIVCASPAKIPNLQFGTLFGGLMRLRSDENGRATIPLEATNLFLVVAEPEGFGWIPNRDLTNNAVMILRPWGRIEGVRSNWKQPVPDEHLRLLPIQYFNSDSVSGFATRPINNVGGNEAWTDNAGQFTFEHVPPLRLAIVRPETQGSSWAWPVEVNAGGTNSLELSTRSRTVTGHVKAGPELGPNINLAGCSGTLVLDSKDQDGLRSSVNFSVSSDGSLHAEGVEPGDYKISGSLLSNNVRVAELETISVHIPEDASPTPESPFDIGSFTLKAVPHLNPM